MIIGGHVLFISSQFLFPLTHEVAIFRAINSTERSFFEAATSTPPGPLVWDISAVVAAFLQTTLARARASDPLSLRPVTLLELSDKFAKYYRKHLIPLLLCLGIKTSGADNFVWSWLPHMRTYVERVFTAEFRNLTEDGEVSASSALIELFPDLMLRAESRASMSLSRVTAELHDALRVRGGYDASADQAASTLAQLLSQRAALMREGATGAHVEALERAVEEARTKYAAITAHTDQRPAAPAAAASTKPRALKARPELHLSPFPSRVSLADALRLVSLLPASPSLSVATLSAIDSSLAIALCALDSTVLTCAVSPLTKPIASARSKSYISALTEALRAEIETSLKSKDDARTLFARLGRSLPATEAAEWLVQAERTVTLPQKQRPAALTRLAKTLTAATEGSGLTLHSAARTTTEALASCAAHLRTRPLVVCVSATDLFAWRFSRKNTFYTDLCRMAAEAPSRLTLVVLGSLPPEEWGGNVHSHLSEWILVGRTRLPITALSVATALHALPSPASSRLQCAHRSLSEHATPQPKTTETVSVGEQEPLADAYVFVPSQRLPRFAQHFALHALHLSTATATALLLHLRQDVVAGVSAGVTLFALWEPRTQTPSKEETQSWSAYLHYMVSRASSASSLAAQLVAASAQELSRLVDTHEGLFVISDHPGRACILSTGKGHDWIRFYTDNIDHARSEAGAEAPPRHSTDEGVWHTWRMQLNSTPAQQIGALSVRRLEDGGGDLANEAQRVFKYALVGSSRFWCVASSSETLLRRLRVLVEARLFDTPDDLVPCAVSGPATLPQLLPVLRRDAANGEPQTRLVSSVEEWLMGSRDSLRDEMLAPNAGATEGDLVVAALMNVSLSDAANWSHWRRELKLDSATAPGWTRVTDRSALPPAVLAELSVAMGALSSNV